MFRISIFVFAPERCASIRVDAEQEDGEMENGADPKGNVEQEDEEACQRVVVMVEIAQPISMKRVDLKSVWIPVCAEALVVRGFGT